MWCVVIVSQMMAGRGRGQLTFSVEIVGIGKGENLPPSSVQPTPLFPVSVWDRIKPYWTDINYITLHLFNLIDNFIQSDLNSIDDTLILALSESRTQDFTTDWATEITQLCNNSFSSSAVTCRAASKTVNINKNIWMSSQNIKVAFILMNFFANISFKLS